MTKWGKEDNMNVNTILKAAAGISMIGMVILGIKVLLDKRQERRHRNLY